MTQQELYKEWCKRINVTANDVVELHKKCLISDDYQSAYLQAVKDSMNMLESIITEQN